MTLNKFIKIKLNEGGITYSPMSGNDANLDIFRIFLTEDIGHSRGSRFRKWALSDDKEDFFIQAGETLLEKENNRICVECTWFSDEPNPPQAELSVEEFISGLDQWNELMKTDPKYIIIRQEDGKITVDGSDSEQMVKKIG